MTTCPCAPTTVYDLAYTYDQLGNRKTRVDSALQEVVEYDYDVDHTATELGSYVTKNNRLRSYVVKRTISSTLQTVRTVTYTYYKSGDASNITIKDNFISGWSPGSSADYDWHHDLALHYFSNGSLRLAVKGKWKLDTGGNPDASTYVPASAWEFRYESPRQRYVAVEYDCNDSSTQSNWTVVDDAMRWTDYGGYKPQSDALITADGEDLVIDDQMHYFGLAGHQPASSTTVYTYYHDDVIASTPMTTGAAGTSATAATTAYTAFGEFVAGAGAQGSTGVTPLREQTRYTYAGGYGYESGFLSFGGANVNLPSVALQHLGARWYQPDIGRFVQRDPIGIYGGKNAYLYVDANPMSCVDSTGNGKIGVAIKTGKGIWRWISRDRAAKEAANGRMIRVCGEGASAEAKRIAREAWPDKTIVRHDAHQDGWMPHYQPKSGGGHVFYVPGANAGVAIFGDNLVGHGVDLLNPLSDIQEIIDLIDALYDCTPSWQIYGSQG